MGDSLWQTILQMRQRVYPATEIIPMSNTAATYLHFFWAGLVKHGQTGGLVPSQRFLIAKMIAPVPETHRGQIAVFSCGPRVVPSPHTSASGVRWNTVRGTAL